MEVNTLVAEKRDVLGTPAARRTRGVGRVPAVVYGKGGECQHVSVRASDFERELRARHRVFFLKVDGQDQCVFLQDLQLDSVTDEALHADFLRIDHDQPIPVEIQIVLLGIPQGLSRGGTLIQDRRTLPVKSLPAAIPLEIEVKVGGVDLGDTIRAGDLALPEGVTLDVPEDTPICHMPGA